MRIGLVTDSTTDLPEDFLRSRQIHVLPSVILDYQTPIEVGRDAAMTLAFHQGELVWRGPSLTTRPASEDEIELFFLQQLALDYDLVFLVTQSGSRSTLAANAREAAERIRRDSASIRAARGIDSPFELEVIDSNTLFTGPGVLCWQIADLIRLGRSPAQIREAVSQSLPQIETLAVVRDVWYIRRRGRARGEHSVNLASALLARAFGLCPLFRMHCGENAIIGRRRGFPAAAEVLLRMVVNHIEQGLALPCVIVSYSGDLCELQQLGAYRELHSRAEAASVELLCSMMSPAGAVWTGPGALTLAFCPIQSLPATGVLT